LIWQAALSSSSLAMAAYHSLSGASSGRSPEDLVGNRIAGWVKKFVPQKGFGFVNSDEFDGDLFFSKRGNDNIAHVNAIEIGTKVEFTIESENSGKCVAGQLVITGEAPPAKLNNPFNQFGSYSKQVPVQSGVMSEAFGGMGGGHGFKSDFTHMAGSGERLAGVVKFFNPVKGWGFVVSDSFQGDLFFSKTQNEGIDNLEGNDPITFCVGLDNSGKPGAVEIQASPVGSYGKAAQKMFGVSNRSDPYGGMGGMGGMSPWQMAQAAGPSMAAAMGGGMPSGVLSGTVKQWNLEKAYGFLTGSQLQGDVFFSATHNQHLQGVELVVGQVCEFEISTEKSGKKVGVNVMPLEQGASQGEETYYGTVSSFNKATGSGMIVSDGFSRPVWFSIQRFPQLQRMVSCHLVGVGTEAEFKVAEEGGKFVCSDLSFPGSRKGDFETYGQ